MCANGTEPLYGRLEQRGAPVFDQVVENPRRYQWLENLWASTGPSRPWLGAIALFPAGWTVQDPEPKPIASFSHDGRLALYWALRVNETGHAAVSWSVAKLVRPLSEEVALVPSELALGEGQTRAVETVVTKPLEQEKFTFLLVTVTGVKTRAILDRVGRENDRKLAHVSSGNVSYFDLGKVKDARIALITSQMGSRGPSESLVKSQDSCKST